MAEHFNTYELRARVLPSVVVLIPIIFIIFLFLGADGINLVNSLTTGIIGIVIAYITGQILAKLGRDLQPKLFKKWGGAPSTRIMRWNNSNLSNEQKQNILQAVKSIFNADMPTEQEETANKQETDKRIDSVFKEVRSYLYEKESKGLWREHLAEYGFARNLLASSWVAAIVAAICAGISFYQWHSSTKVYWILFGVLCCLWALAFLISRYTFLLSFTKHLANRYAESAWLAFLNSTRKSGGAS